MSLESSCCSTEKYDLWLSLKLKCFISHLLRINSDWSGRSRFSEKEQAVSSFVWSLQCGWNLIIMYKATLICFPQDNANTLSRWIGWKNRKRAVNTPETWMEIKKTTRIKYEIYIIRSKQRLLGMGHVTTLKIMFSVDLKWDGKEGYERHQQLYRNNFFFNYHF